MKRNVGITLILTLLALGLSNHAQAQFWKNWFKKKNHHHHTRVVKEHEHANNMHEHKDEKEERVKYPDTRMKYHYRIDILVPLYLDDLVKNGRPTYSNDNVPDKAEPGVDFYEGVGLAADTLNAMHYDIDIYVHDITSAGKHPEQLIANKTLDSSDLIIGSIEPRDIPAIAHFADKHQINFISAFSPYDAGVRENPYFTLLQPNLQTHCEWIRSTIDKKYAPENVTLIYRTTAQADDNAYHYFLDGGDKDDYRKVSCDNLLPPNVKLNDIFSSSRTNVIVMTILDVSYAEALLRRLYTDFPNYHFEVYGMPSWRLISALHKADAFPNVGVYTTWPFYYDVANATGRYIETNFRKKFDGKPGELVYRGFETTVWYADLLRRYGTIFNKHLKDNNPAPFTQFHIEPQWDDNLKFLYNENQHLCLFHYQSGSYIVQQ